MSHLCIFTFYISVVQWWLGDLLCRSIVNYRRSFVVSATCLLIPLCGTDSFLHRSIPWVPFWSRLAGVGRGWYYCSSCSSRCAVAFWSIVVLFFDCAFRSWVTLVDCPSKTIWFCNTQLDLFEFLLKHSIHGALVGFSTRVSQAEDDRDYGNHSGTLGWIALRTCSENSVPRLVINEPNLVFSATGSPCSPTTVFFLFWCEQTLQFLIWRVLEVVALNRGQT